MKKKRNNTLTKHLKPNTMTSTFSALFAAGMLYGVIVCAHMAFRGKPSCERAEPDVNKDVDKIFQCINSCIHFKQLYACLSLIDSFKQRHPDYEYTRIMLHGFISYKERLLISKYSSLETMMDAMQDDLECEMALEAAREILEGK